MSNFQSKINVATAQLNSDPVAFATSTSGKPRELDAIDETFFYRACFPDVGVIQLRRVHSKKTDPVGVSKFLKDSGFELIRLQSSWNADTNIELNTMYMWAHDSGIMVGYAVQVKGTEDYNDDEEWHASDDPINEESVMIQIGWINPIEPSEEIEIIWGNFKKAIKDNPAIDNLKAKIGIISHNGHNLYVKNFKIKERDKFEHLDLHYGEGFTNFNESLIERIKNETKGLVLFHGEPGTGKTQYIRYLLKVLRDNNKGVLYVPPSFSSQLTEPHMIEFISNWVKEEDKDCILLIEDAEPLLEIRKGGDGRTTGISNLLNMTDGILNDMLGLMVIATFNTEISKIDSALLRPGRLIARKEFTKISELDSHKLAKAINIEWPELEYPTSLADFYNAKKEKEVLIHQVKENKIARIGFGN